MSVEQSRSYITQAQALIAKALNELPYTPPSTPTGPVVNVNGGDSLQSAIDMAVPGTVLSLEAGASFVGPFNLRGANGVTITSRTTVPPPGVRCTTSAAAGFAKIRANTAGEAAIRNDPAGAAKWTLLGIEVVGDPNGGSSTVDLDVAASEIMLDRCYIHGDSAKGAKRGVGLNCAKGSVINSLLLDFKRSGQDTQAIAGGLGPGPYLIENCHLEASGENVLFGGSDPTIPGLIPSDIVMRRCLLKKPAVWQARTTNPWTVKNLFELKVAQRVLIEGNIMEGNWLSGQVGYAVVLTTRNQDGGQLWATIKDVVFRNNIVRGSASFLNIMGIDNHFPTVRMENVKLLNNLAYDIDPKKWGDVATGAWGSDKAMIVTASPLDVEIGFNTIITTNPGSFLALDGPDKAAGLRIHHNVLYEGDYGMVGSGTGLGQASWDANVESGEFTGNVIRRGTTGRDVRYPGANTIAPPDAALVDAQYRVLPAYAGAGCDIDVLLKAVGLSSL